MIYRGLSLIPDAPFFPALLLKMGRPSYTFIQMVFSESRDCSDFIIVQHISHSANTFNEVALSFEAPLNVQAKE